MRLKFFFGLYYPPFLWLPVSDLEVRRAGPTPGLRLMEVKFSAASFVVGVVGTDPMERNLFKPLTPVAAEGVVAVIMSTMDIHIKNIIHVFQNTFNIM